MTIPTKASFSGFIASEPRLTATQSGTARFYARVGHEHWQRDDNGNWTQLDTTFHDLVQYRKSAQRAHEQFKVGDRFVAEGQVRTYEREYNGETVALEEFIANKIGHDTARTSYAVDRGPRRQPVDRTQGQNLDPVTAGQAHSQRTEQLAPATAYGQPDPPDPAASRTVPM